MAATASYLQARVAGGEWLLRIEDIDPPREAPGAADQIIASLGAHGFRWTGAVSYQSQRLERFHAAVETLLRQQLAYPCDCSRQEIRVRGRTGPSGPVYPGTCRSRPPGTVPSPHAIRVRTERASIEFHDGLQGKMRCDIATEIGDFVLRRKDGLTAYALAVALDDAEQGITEVVRGVDLLAFTPAQIHVLRLLRYPAPRYVHVPVAINAAGQKLSKQTGALPVDDARAPENLFRCLKFLRQNPPDRLRGQSIAKIWRWATSHWRLDRLLGCRERVVTSLNIN